MGTSKGAIARWKSRERIEAAKLWISSQLEIGISPTEADMTEAGHTRDIALAARAEMVRDGMIDRKHGCRAARNMRPVDKPVAKMPAPEPVPKPLTREIYRGPGVSGRSPSPEVPKPAKAKPKEPKAAWLERLQRQIDALAAANCMRTVEPRHYEPARVAKPEAWQTAKERKTKPRYTPSRIDREFGVGFDLEVSERGLRDDGFGQASVYS